MLKEFTPSDLQTKGYTVIKNIVSTDKITNLINMYSKLQNDPEFGVVFDDLNLSMLPDGHGMDEVLMPLIEAISQNTDINVNILEKGGLFFETTRGKFEWHIDHLSYYNWQTAYHYINFWIPLIKPSIDKSGIQLIPQNALKSALGNKKFQDQVYNQGAKRFSIFKNCITCVFDDENELYYEWPVNIERIAVTPNITVGDMIVYRGDVIHKTQDVDEKRLAISIRAVDQNLLFDKEMYFRQSEIKRSVLEKNVYRTNKFVNFLNSKVEQKFPLREIIENC